MGLFSSFKSTSSAASDFKDVYIDIVEKLTSYSMGTSRYDEDIIKQEFEIAMRKLVAITYRVSNPLAERFNIYRNSNVHPDVRFSMPVALILIDRIGIEVFEFRQKLTRSLGDRLITQVLSYAPSGEYESIRYSYR